MADLEWKEGLSPHVQRARVGRLGTLTVVWDPGPSRDAPQAGKVPPYVVTVFAHRMRPRFWDLEEAKRYAERVARWAVGEVAEMPGVAPGRARGGRGVRLYVTMDETGQGLRPWAVVVSRPPATAEELRTLRGRVRMACGDPLAGLAAFSPLRRDGDDGTDDGTGGDFVVLSVQPFD